MRLVAVTGLVLCAVCLASTVCAFAGETISDVSFKATVDGTEQRYVVMQPDDLKADERVDVLIALHGHGADRWQFIKDGRDECRGAREVAIEHRMLFVSPDYRAKTSWMGPKAEADVVQIIAELRKSHRVRRMLLTGGSMGGTGALTFAALHPELIDGVAALNGTANLLEYENFQDAISESFGGKKTQIPAEFKKRSAEYWPEKLTMPVAITTGGRDSLVPPESCLRLAGVLRKLDRHILLLHRKEGGHSTDLSDTRAAIEFVMTHSMPTD